ncbi:DsbA family protein [Minwuia sp.]|uniref:DsbA family protein n=1 Tax=Minwuia sp. TaxID=2493630 RepID=UPI003A9329D5
MTDIIHFTDFKSPFAYLAMEDAFRLEDESGQKIRWVHYTLEIPEFLGAVETRSENDWRKVKYAYMDARRLANRKGLTVLGPKKIFNSRPAGIGMTYAIEQDLLRPYASTVFERFFKRDLNVDVPDEIRRVLSDIGADVTGFDDWLTGDGLKRHEQERQEAIDMGVFGVPTFAIDGELFWGGDRIWMVEEKLKDLAG